MSDPRPVRPELPAVRRDVPTEPTGLSKHDARLLAEARAVVRAARSDRAGLPKRIVMLVGGAAAALAGGWMLLARMQVRSGFGVLFGRSITGPALIGLLVGIGLVASGRRSGIGALLTIASLVAIVASVLWNLRVWFAPTPLTTMLVIFVLLAGGLGLVARSLGPRP